MPIKSKKIRRPEQSIAIAFSIAEKVARKKAKKKSKKD